MIYRARIVSGTGIASNMHERRIGPVEELLGVRLHPGTLNLRLDRALDWTTAHSELTIPDARDWSNLGGEWFTSTVRLYPVVVDAEHAWAMRLDRSRASKRTLELVAPVRLRDVLVEPVEVRHA